MLLDTLLYLGTPDLVAAVRQCAGALSMNDPGGARRPARRGVRRRGGGELPAEEEEAHAEVGLQGRDEEAATVPRFLVLLVQL